MQNQKWRSASSVKIKEYILVTGASGFIGSALCRELLSSGRSIKGTVRSQQKLLNLPDGIIGVHTGAINGTTAWGAILEGVDAVVHLAGVVHKNNKRIKDNLDEYRQVNIIGTEHFARACAQAGVRRFVFLSSIGVNGEFTSKNSFTENDIPCPVSAYAISKWEAEQALHKIAEGTGMEIVILRSPLVYGPNAPGNFRKLMYLIKTGLPLPLEIKNSLRSFIYLDNLIDAIITCIVHPLAAGETFLVSDGQDVSTPNLIRMISQAMNKKIVLFSLQPGLLKTLCKIAGKTEGLEKLTGSLLVDSRKIRDLLGWKPPFTLEEGIRKAVKD